LDCHDQSFSCTQVQRKLEQKIKREKEIPCTIDSWKRGKNNAGRLCIVCMIGIFHDSYKIYRARSFRKMGHSGHIHWLLGVNKKEDSAWTWKLLSNILIYPRGPSVVKSEGIKKKPILAGQSVRGPSHWQKLKQCWQGNDLFKGWEDRKKELKCFSFIKGKMNVFPLNLQLSHTLYTFRIYNFKLL